MPTKKIVAFAQSESLDEFKPLPDANRVRTPGESNVATLRGKSEKEAL